MKKTKMENITDAETAEQANLAATLARHLEDAVAEGNLSELEILDAMASYGIQLVAIEPGKNVPSLTYFQILEGSLGVQS